MRTVEEAAFAAGITADALMEEAGKGIARAVSKCCPGPGRCLVIARKGHNAGDALVAARVLAQAGWEIETHLIFPRSKLSPLTSQKLQELEKLPANTTGGATVILDGLLGLGSHPPLRGPIRDACRTINSLGRKGAYVFAVDFPSGLDGDSGAADPDCVIADFTVAIGAAKTGLLADSALDHVGRLEIAVLRALALTAGVEPEAEVAIPEILGPLLPRRKFSAYKNQFGRIGIVAGSRGLSGAAVLCSLGALRAGAGLVELFVPEEIYQLVAGAAPAEAMVKPLTSDKDLLQQTVDVWAIGPGLGRDRGAGILQLIREAQTPMVIDADALNLLSGQMDILSAAKGPRLLTPHPGEMKRLWPNDNGTRAEIATRFCQKYKVTLLLKGSRTVIAEKDRLLSYNSTGNPGMATGGMGDVLTGVCGALFGAKLTPRDAARVGAWVCGRAAELALFSGRESEESLLPSDLLRHLGLAFRELHSASPGE
jgi:NAD(P)H-hydrate epimerase